MAAIVCLACHHSRRTATHESGLITVRVVCISLHYGGRTALASALLSAVGTIADMVYAAIAYSCSVLDSIGSFLVV